MTEKRHSTRCGDIHYFIDLVGHGYRMLADAMEKNLPYEITCPALLICGTKDRAGSTLNYNKRWTVNSGIPIAWIEGAGHNSNTDCPEDVNRFRAMGTVLLAHRRGSCLQNVDNCRFLIMACEKRGKIKE